jgi:ABC-type phosphonate transport system ATPase subunit
VRQASKAARKMHSVAAATAGMRRVECVKMVEEDRPRFFVVGVGHRFPIEREVTTSVALALMKSLPCRHEWKRAEKDRAEKDVV